MIPAPGLAVRFFYISCGGADVAKDPLHQRGREAAFDPSGPEFAARRERNEQRFLNVRDKFPFHAFSANSPSRPTFRPHCKLTYGSASTARISSTYSRQARMNAMHGIAVFSALSEALRAGFQIYERTSDGFLVRARTSRGVDGCLKGRNSGGEP
jgi:hypothetical protein